MSFYIQSLRELVEKARAAYRANLKGSDASIWPNNVYASAKVIGGMTFEAMGFLSYISRQKFAHTAPDLDSLLLHGAEYGLPIKSAQPAGPGKVVATTAAAIAIEAGAQFARSDGVIYLATAGGSLTGAGELSFDVIAAADGKAGNAEAGTPLAVVSGVTWTGDSAPTFAVGADGITLGLDQEDIEDYRARILFRKRTPPHGGSPADYVIWASAVSGVTRVYVEPRYAGPGTVRVWPIMDGLYADGIPQAADIARVRMAIEAVMPASGKLAVQAAVARVVNITVSGLTPDTTAVREAVLAELRDAFLRRSRVAGIAESHPGMPFLATPVTFSRSWLWQAIANATGEDRHVLAAPAADISLVTGEIATLGTVTFSSTS